MPDHYVTIHWPPLPGSEPVPERWIYLQRYRDLQAGDLALIYETKANPSREANGKLIKTTGQGRGGIVSAVELIEKPQPVVVVQKNSREQIVLTEKVVNDERLIQWSYMARTRTIKEGFLGLADIRRLLDKPGWNPRINGGITGISESDYKKLFEHIG